MFKIRRILSGDIIGLGCLTNRFHIQYLVFTMCILCNHKRYIYRQLIIRSLKIVRTIMSDIRSTVATGKPSVNKVRCYNCRACGHYNYWFFDPPHTNWRISLYVLHNAKHIPKSLNKRWRIYTQFIFIEKSHSGIYWLRCILNFIERNR